MNAGAPQAQQNNPVKKYLRWTVRGTDRRGRFFPPNKISGYMSGYFEKRKRPNHQRFRRFLMVESRGVEPLSENLSARLSTSVVGVLTFPQPKQLPPTGSGLR